MVEKLFTNKQLNELAREDLEHAIQGLYDLKFDEFDPHIEDTIKLNELTIKATKSVVDEIFNELFPIKND